MPDARNRDLRLNNEPGYTAYSDGEGTLVSVGANQYAVITDIMASTTGELREDSGAGDTIITIPVQGHCNLVSPIRVTKGADVYNVNDSMRVTINYWLERA